MLKESLLLSLAILGLYTSSAQADSIGLFELRLYLDGSVTTFSTPEDVACPGCSATLDTSGLGTISFDSLSAGAHKIGMMIDYEIAEATNTFFNEYGEVSGTPAAGLTWEIDEPGFVFGDIFDNFNLGALDNSNGVPATSPDDVSMALMWDFVVAPTEIAKLVFNVSSTGGSGIFTLIHRDSDVSDSVFFSSLLDISTVQEPPSNEVPEPSMTMLMTAGLASLWRKRKCRN